MQTNITQKSRYEDITLEHKVNIIMPETFYKKVQYLCQRISEVEWSGILLYSTEGSFKDLKNFVITLQDIIPMNKGTKSYTSFNLNEKKRDGSGVEDRHIDYVMENPEAFDWKIGLIHSHNTFGVFFSGTDWEELQENAACHNFYLSLICNNKMDFTAKIGFEVTGEVENKVNYKGLDETGKHFTYLQSVPVKNKYKKFFVIDTNIIQPEIVKPQFEPFFLDAVEDIITKAAYTPLVNQYQHYSHNAPGFRQRNHVPSHLPANVPVNKPYTAPSSSTKEIEDMDEHSKLEVFLIQCVTLSAIQITGIDTIKKAIFREKSRGTFLNLEEYLKKFRDFYLTNFKHFYPESTEEDFTDITENAIDLILTPLRDFPQFQIVDNLVDELLDLLTGDEEEEDLFEALNAEQ